MEKTDVNSDSDEDCCNGSEIGRFFNEAEQIVQENCAKHQETYILHVTGTLESTPNLSICLSNKHVEVYALSDRNLGRIASFGGFFKPSIESKFSPGNNNLLFAASEDGFICLYDVRVPYKAQGTFTDTTSNETKQTLTCFDVSPNDRLLAAGTELYQGDAYVLFWDIRKLNLMGAYWDGHMEDITQVVFHPEDMDRLISASTDGYINLYDLNEGKEDDAFQDCLNTESSVEKVIWFGQNYEKIACITHTEELQLWNLNQGKPFLTVSRSLLAEKLMRKSENYACLSSVHDVRKRDSLLALAGSNSNKVCCRGLEFKQSKGPNYKIEPLFNLQRNTQIVRTSWLNENANIFVTGGEKGLLDVWKVPL